MNARKLIDLRRQAEKAVAEMPDGDMKVKAFEVILRHLLTGTAEVVSPTPREEPEPPRKARSPRESSGAKSISGRILVLRDEGFFAAQKTLGEVREELRAHGWHYPLTTLSGRMQALVRARQLRREKAKHGNKQIWKYSTP